MKPFLKVLLTFFLLAITLSFGNNDMPNICSVDKNQNEFTILSYHEIADKSNVLDNTYAVPPKHFEEQMKWLINNGYHFISLDDILAYRLHHKPLPQKAVYITFDDGYSSVYHNAFPIIKKYKIPTMIALVGSWLKPKDKSNFAGKIVDRREFLSQAQIKEMVASGLVDIGSHTYGLHHGITGNPQGNSEPAVTTHEYFPTLGKYESDKNYQKRIYDDLKKNSEFLKQYTGITPRVIVWPYGHYNKEVRQIATKLGMSTGLTLDDGSNTKITPLWGLRRILVDNTMTLKDLKLNMWYRNQNLSDDDRTTKAVQVDLDYIYDKDPVQQDRNLGALLDRLIKLGVNTVYLQAFADPDANGAANAVYFPNRVMPMKADLFNRVAWQISTRTKVKRVYAWMPLIAWELPNTNKATNDKVVTLQVDSSHLNMGYPRLSPFSPKARAMIKEIYEDLGRNSYIDGVLFHDDITLSDFEDNSKFARLQYKKWGLPPSVQAIRANRVDFEKWTQLKTQYLDNFAMQMAQILRDEQPGLKTARNLYAQVALNKDAQEWYAQSLPESIKDYDYTAIMAMPYMEQADNPKEFYKKIVDNVKAVQCGLERTVMELQSVNWRKNDEPISKSEMKNTIGYLYSLGVHHVGYYPDNVFKNVPDADAMNKAFSQKPLRMHDYIINTLDNNTTK